MLKNYVSSSRDCECFCVCWAVFSASYCGIGVAVSWCWGVVVLGCRGEGRLVHTCVSFPCRFLTLLGLALPLAGTAYVAARGWGSDHRASPSHGAHSATYGSLPLRETERSGPRNRIQETGGLPHGSLPATPSRGKSRHLNKQDHS